MSRQYILTCGFVLVASVVAFADATKSDDVKKPNFVFILADDMGYSDLGCYGGEIETPNLDALASSGLRYTQFYNTARCWPTRAALLSGYYAQQVGRDKLPNNGGGGGGKNKRPKWGRLLPEILKPLGYRNYHSGKWHIDGKVLAAGFDRSLDMRNQGSFFTAAANMVDDKPIEIGDETNYYATTAVADHAIECLDDHLANHNDQPFFHYVAFIAPHFPLHAKPEDIARYRGKYDAGWDEMRRRRHERQKALDLRASLSKLEPTIGPPYEFPEAIKQLGPAEINRPLPWNELTPEQQAFQATKMEIHAAMVDRMDREIGRIVEKLKVMNEFDNTLIMFASDNGASAEIMVRHGGHDPQATPGSAKSYLCLGPGFSSASNTPFRRHKTWVHEGGISTPLVVSWPDGIKTQGELRRTPAHVIDFWPTVCDVLDVEQAGRLVGSAAPALPGKSLLASFNEDAVIERECIWWLHEDNRAIRRGDWKLVAAKGDPWELYDLSKDRAETQNVAPKYPERVAEMAKRWQQHTNETAKLVSGQSSQ